VKRPHRAAKRGRPPKFGRPGRVVAITLPEETVRGLKRIHADLGWAIVQLVEGNADRYRNRRHDVPDTQLVSLSTGQSLIVVNRDVLKHLPGVSVIPLHDNLAFLAFDHTASLADLELAVLERLASKSVGVREREALSALRRDVRRWRRDPKLRSESRSIIVLERG
jgi:hypothetical protein